MSNSGFSKLNKKIDNNNLEQKHNKYINFKELQIVKNSYNIV